MILPTSNPYVGGLPERNWIRNWTLVLLQLWSWNMTQEYHEIYHFWWFSDCLGSQDALLNSPSDWLSASFPTEHGPLPQCSLHSSCSDVSTAMCFSETRAEEHVETAAGTKCSALYNAIRPSSREHDSDSQVLKEKASLGRPIYLTAGRRELEAISKVISNFQKPL